MNTITTDLETLRKNIREENNKARSVARKSLEHVRNCGNMIIELKARTQHGSFQYELKELGIEQRTANNYMRIATNWKHVSTLNHGVRDALKLLARVDDPPPTPATKARTEVIEAEVIEPLTEAESARLVVLEAVIEEGIKKLPKTLDDTTGDLESVVVDGTKNENPKTDCWAMARDFIATLKSLPAWQERQAIADVMHACRERFAELDKLKGKEKPNITKP